MSSATPTLYGSQVAAQFANVWFQLYLKATEMLDDDAAFAQADRALARYKEIFNGA